ncbi:MAG: hypothetical protein QOF63_3983 [Thermoanaerobaculia bacterium]|jgi:hypothetical protein|nr:hypothetical protein [Thermoanaerobaculia bacterium]
MLFAKSSLVSTFHDAALSPEAWPRALKALTDAAGAAGAALIVSNKSTGNVDDACFSGLSAGFKSDYVRHYAALDPYSPLLDGSWKKLSDCLPDSLLRKSEWYTDFVLTCGVRDILGARLVDTPHHCVIFGIHQQIGRTFSDKVDSVVNLVAAPLTQAARLHAERFSSLKSGMWGESRTEILVEGSRFYFHVDNGNRYPDETGSVFSSPEDAAAHALVLARELAQDASWHGSSILLTDDWGQEISRVRIGRDLAGG